ncbi:MAG: DUF1015 domain-containing protein [Nocardioidaceae bacterium]|nr:DUF1015 domain-containing protein [Nocardioidaceae bacterium]
MVAVTLVPPPYVAGPLRLHPFAALRLVPRRVGDPSTGRAFARPYRDVAERLQRWQARGLLERDAHEAVYLHEYSSNGITVRGLVGALDVSRRAIRPSDRAVLPHEGIHPEQADDLADRMDEMQLNPAPILLVHNGTDRLREVQADLAGREPDHEFVDRSQQHHRIWAITDPERLDVIANELASSTALIADGHHRYAAYLRLQRRRPSGPCDSGLAMLVDQRQTPLFLGPIHRTLAGTSFDDMSNAADSIGVQIEVVDEQKAVAGLASDALPVTDGERWGLIRLDHLGDRIAVEVLHQDLLPALPHGPSAIGYHHTVEDALNRAQDGSTVAVLLPAPPVDTVLKVAAADRLLPEKATSFQPKPSLGVLIRPLPAGSAEPS